MDSSTPRLAWCCHHPTAPSAAHLSAWSEPCARALRSARARLRCPRQCPGSPASALSYRPRLPCLVTSPTCCGRPSHRRDAMPVSVRSDAVLGTARAPEPLQRLPRPPVPIRAPLCTPRLPTSPLLSLGKYLQKITQIGLSSSPQAESPLSASFDLLAASAQSPPSGGPPRNPPPRRLSAPSPAGLFASPTSSPPQSTPTARPKHPQAPPSLPVGSLDIPDARAPLPRLKVSPGRPRRRDRTPAAVPCHRTIAPACRQLHRWYPCALHAQGYPFLWLAAAAAAATVLT